MLEESFKMDNILGRRGHLIIFTLFLFIRNLLLIFAAKSSNKRNVYPPGFKALIHSKLKQSLRTPIHSIIDTSNVSADLDNRSSVDDGSAMRSSNRHRRTEEKSKTQPIRIKFITTPLEQTTAMSNDEMTKLRGDVIINSILPQIASNFASSLKVVPTKSLAVPKETCFNYFTGFVTSAMSKPGIQNQDLVIFISAYDSLGGVPLCNKDPNLSTLAVSSPCNVDFNDRPVVGFANICLNALNIRRDNTIDQNSALVMEHVLTHEMIHILGLNSALFKYYRSAYDNTPLTPRVTSFFGGAADFEFKEYDCVNDKPDQVLEVINENTLVHKNEMVKTYNGASRERGYYEIVLPTVRQVVQNQFNCQSLTGARLENQPTSDEDCIGSHFDERFFFTDIMSALYDDDAAYYSPLTLALLEDTGWYKCDFTRAQNSPFGLNMGCDFVNKDCIVDGRVPAHSNGFFCNNMVNKVLKCGPSHHFRGQCDLGFNSSPKRGYFDELMGPQFIHADFCPIVQNDITDCDDESAKKIDQIEIFHSKSRCMSVDLEDGKRSAVCIKASCNEEAKMFEFSVGYDTYGCSVEDEGKQIQVTHNSKSYGFICPRLTQVCPE